VHTAALSDTPGLDLVAACDQDASLWSVLPPGVLFFDSSAELLATGGFETVVVATPNATHNRIARQVIAAGYHVILEKPAAASLYEIDGLQQLAGFRGLHVYYAFHAALSLEVKALVAHLQGLGDKYGPLTAFTSRFYDPYLDTHGKLSRHARSLDECWSDSGVNALSVLDCVKSVNHLQRAWRRQSTLPTKSARVLSASVGFHFPVLDADGAGFGLIDTAWDQGIDHKITVLCFGQTGWQLEIDHSEQRLTRRDPRGHSTELARFHGDRLLNHYLGVFGDYRERVKAGNVMNGSAARRIHAALFDGMP